MSNSNSSTGFFSRFLTFFLGMIFGIIFFVAALGGGAYWAYSKMKLKTIEKTISKDIFGAELKEKTLKDLVDILSKINSGDTTINDLEEMFTLLGDTLDKQFPTGKIGFPTNAPIAELDLSLLRSMPIKDLTSNLSDALTVTASLESLTETGLISSLPDMPLIQGTSDPDNPLAVYVMATSEKDGEHPFKKEYASKTGFYTLTYAYDEAEVDGGKIAGEYKYYAEFYTAPDILAVDGNDDGNVVDDYPDGTQFFVKKEVYNLAGESVYGTVELYFMSDGIKSLPLTDAFGALSDAMDFNTLTLNEMEAKFGINMGSNFMLDKIKNVPVNRLSEGIDEQIDNVELREIIKDSGTSPIISAILYQPKLDEFGNPELDGEGEPVLEPVKVGGISHRVSMLTMGEVMEITLSSPKVLQSLKDYKVDEVGGAFETLTIEQMVDGVTPSNTILWALKDATLLTLADSMNALTLQDIMSTDIYEGYIVIKDTADSFTYADYTAKYSFKNVYIDDGTDKVIVTAEDLFEGEEGFETLKPAYSAQILYTDDVKAGMFRYLVMDRDPISGEYTEVAVSVQGLGERMGDVSANISVSTLYELNANGIITLTDESVLDKRIQTNPFDSSAKSDPLGTMNISELLEILSQIAVE